MPDHIRNIAIVGGSGQVGSQILSNLLKGDEFNITAISRSSSKSTFPDGVSVKKGEYDDLSFLEESLQDQDVLILALGLEASPDVQTHFHEAAAKAGVPWIVPNHWSSDGANAKLVENFPSLADKEKTRRQIEELGKSSWIAICNNQWFDYGMSNGYFGIDIPKRTATFYEKGTNPVITTTIAQVGRTVAAVLRLPISEISTYKNNFVYIQSFNCSQKDMLESVQRVTKTGEQDWKVSYKSIDEFLEEGWKERREKGEEGGFVNLIYGPLFKEGLGDQYYGRELANEKLGLPKDDLDEATRRVIKSLEEAK